MRHRVKGRKLKRDTAHRKAMLRNMVTSLLENEKIETTEAKAKELRGVAERIITLGKRGSLHARRQVLEVVRDKSVVKKVFDELGPRYKDRPGGYTRVIKLGSRLGDNAPMGIIELVKEPVKEKGKPARRRRRRAVAKPKAETAKTTETAEPEEKTKEKKAKGSTKPAPKKEKTAKNTAETDESDKKAEEEKKES